MQTREYILGVDTSNYTTSVAVADTSGNIIANIKRPLPVAEGERGLRQSDALFSHVKNLPSAFDEAREIVDGGNIAAVGVSEKPRNVDGSYMPCFLAGVASAHALATEGAELYKFSHQCGHIMAALYSSGRLDLLGRTFGAFHVSGGTTELLRVSGAECGFHAELVGGTLDINAGQLVDRIGVAMGLRFPAGRELEELARKNTAKVPRARIAGDGLHVNLSGLENKALKLFGDTGDMSLTAAFVLDVIGRALEDMSRSYIEKYGEGTILYAGGVMSNKIIRKYMEDRLDAAFAEPAFSADNAAGVAYLAYLAYKKEKGDNGNGRDA